MLKKDKYVYIIWIFLLLFFIISIIILYFFKTEEKEPINIHKKTIELYFNDTATGKLRLEERVIKGNTQQELVVSVLEQLQVGSKIEGNTIVVPQDIRILHIDIKEDIAIINLSKEYDNLSLGEKIMCRAAIVWSVTSLDFIDYVCIKVEGKELEKVSGEPIGLMNRENTMINPIVSPEAKRYEIVSLYFTDKTKQHLVKEEREIEISQIQTREKSVVEQLILGAKEQEHISILPSDIKIRNVTTTKEGVCYVDLSNDSIDKIINGNINEQIAIYSIVNSLVSLYNVEKVQFLIEGEKIEETMGNLDYTKPFESRNI